ncbi:MAG: hypothetical protein IBJ07_01695 [Rhizobiaceae bacterium]|nr:hypothetical protein [Rhizobiaceae bacterium]
MTFISISLLIASTLTFVAAASAAKAWAVSENSVSWLFTTLVLYTLGNLIMLRLIREVGMGVALSLSAVIQLVAINIVAFALYDERVSGVQSVGLVLAVMAVALITFGASES